MAKNKNLKLIPFSKVERSRWEARLNATFAKDDEETKQLKADIDAKAKKWRAGKFDYAKLKDVKLWIFITSYWFAAQNAIQLAQPKPNDDESLSINQEEQRLWEDRFNGFKQSMLAEDVAMMKDIIKNSKAHKKTVVLKNTNIKWIKIWLFACAYVQTGFFSDEILGVHKLPVNVIN